MHSPEALHAVNHHVIPALEAQGTIQHDITLGAHHLCILSDQSIIVRCEQNETDEAAQEFHLDAIETYRLMICLHEVFQQAPIHLEETQRCPIDTEGERFYND